jgi:hypothetical protein
VSTPLLIVALSWKRNFFTRLHRAERDCKLPFAVLGRGICCAPKGSRAGRRRYSTRLGGRRGPLAMSASWKSSSMGSHSSTNLFRDGQEDSTTGLQTPKTTSPTHPRPVSELSGIPSISVFGTNLGPVRQGDERILTLADRIRRRRWTVAPKMTMIDLDPLMTLRAHYLQVQTVAPANLFPLPSSPCVLRLFNN